MPVTTPDTVALSVVEFEVCWELAGLGALPLVLDLPRQGRTPAERQRVVAEVLAGLRDRGLAGRGGPRPELVRDLTRLARFTWAVDARIIRTGLVRARGGARAGWATLAVHDGPAVTLWTVPEHALVAEVVALAGQAPTSRVDSVSVRAAALDGATSRAAGGMHAFAERLAALGERVTDARAVARVCDGALARGQFGVRTGDTVGSRRVIGYHDSAAGRFLQLRRDGWATFTPATQAQLAAQISGLLDEVRG